MFYKSGKRISNPHCCFQISPKKWSGKHFTLIQLAERKKKQCEYDPDLTHDNQIPTLSFIKQETILLFGCFGLHHTEGKAKAKKHPYNISYNTQHPKCLAKVNIFVY